jgi:hypothetical protein
MEVCIHVSYVFMCVCVYVCMYVCVRVYMYGKQPGVLISIYLCVYAYDSFLWNTQKSRYVYATKVKVCCTEHMPLHEACYSQALHAALHLRGVVGQVVKEVTKCYEDDLSPIHIHIYICIHTTYPHKKTRIEGLDAHVPAEYLCMHVTECIHMHNM